MQNVDFLGLLNEVAHQCIADDVTRKVRTIRLLMAIANYCKHDLSLRDAKKIVDFAALNRDRASSVADSTVRANTQLAAILNNVSYRDGKFVFTYDGRGSKQFMVTVGSNLETAQFTEL